MAARCVPGGQLAPEWPLEDLPEPSPLPTWRPKAGLRRSAAAGSVSSPRAPRWPRWRAGVQPASLWAALWEKRAPPQEQQGSVRPTSKHPGLPGSGALRPARKRQGQRRQRLGDLWDRCLSLGGEPWLPASLRLLGTWGAGCRAVPGATELAVARRGLSSSGQRSSHWEPRGQAGKGRAEETKPADPAGGAQPCLAVGGAGTPQSPGGVALSCHPLLRVPQAHQALPWPLPRGAAGVARPRPGAGAGAGAAGSASPSSAVAAPWECGVLGWEGVARSRSLPGKPAEPCREGDLGWDTRGHLAGS